MSQPPAPIPAGPPPGGDAKELVRQATDIVDLVGGYLQLRRQGRNYVGLCPWHDDTRPSMQVNPERQTFKCWVCDIGGDVFSFLMKIDGLEFREALETLADRAGIPLTKPQGGQAQPGGPGDKKTLLAAAAWAEEQFYRCLQTESFAEPARRYLSERGIAAESINRFRIGFAPDRWDWLLAKSRSTPYSTAVLDRIGLVKQRQSGGGWYDFYRGRVIFPIHDIRSRPIAFGGRVLPEFSENAGGKYINSPETPLFSKSNQLYALDLARDAIAREGRIVVTEGYTDVVMAHQHGVENVVAVLGTALGEKHLPLLRRFTDSIALVLDGDEAGQRRTNEVLELFVANQIDLRILGLPGGLDPCDFIAKPKEGFGADAFRRLVEQAPDALEHKMQEVTKGLVTSSDTHGVATAVEQLLATLAKVGAGVGEASSHALLREQSLLGRLSRRFQLPEEGLRQRLVAMRRGAAKPQSPASAAPPVNEPAKASLPPREAELIELLLEGAETARAIFEAVSPDYVSTETAKTVFALARDGFEEHGEVDFHWLMDATEDEALKSLLVRADEARQEKAGTASPQRVDHLIESYRRQQDDALRHGNHAALRAGRLDHHEEEEVLSNLFQKLKDRQTGPLSTDG
ncbi:MAG: DNA primase [Planctomycetota bacterium]